MKNKKILSWILAVVMIVSSLPIGAIFPAGIVLADTQPFEITMGATDDGRTVLGDGLYVNLFEVPAGTTRILLNGENGNNITQISDLSYSTFLNPNTSWHEFVLNDFLMDEASKEMVGGVIGFEFDASTDYYCFIAYTDNINEIYMIRVAPKTEAKAFEITMGATDDGRTVLGDGLYVNLFDVPVGTTRILLNGENGNNITQISDLSYSTFLEPNTSWHEFVLNDFLMDEASKEMVGGVIGFEFDALTDYYCFIAYTDNMNEIYMIRVAGEAATDLFISEQPKNATVGIGEAVLFSVTAANGTKPYTYQWQQSANGTDWTDIEGAVSASYEIASSTEAMNGMQVRCKVTDSVLAAVTSKAATLMIVDRSALKTAIDKVTGDGAANYYQSGDIWNGREENLSGFWARMQLTLTEAQRIYANASATQQQVTNITDNLNFAIAKLIPITQVNASSLYHMVRGEIANPRKAGDYSAELWNGYQEAFAAAQDILSSLFDVNGNATSLNKASAQGTLDAAKQALQTQISNLQTYSSYDSVVSSFTYAKDLYSGISRMLQSHPLSAADYTAESWVIFETPLSTVREFPAFTPVKSVESIRQMNEYITAVLNLYTAYTQQLVSNKSSITVSLRVADNLGAKNNAEKFSDAAKAAFDAEVTVSGHTLADVLPSADLSVLFNDVNNPSTFVYINGIYVHQTMSHLSIFGQLDPSKIAVKDGDDIVIVRADTPKSSYYVSTGNAFLSQYIDSMATLNITNSGAIEVEEGEAFTLNVEKTGGAFNTYTGAGAPAEGVGIFTSEPAQSLNAAGAAYNNTGFVTGADGSASVTLYAAGYYRVSAIDVRTDKMGSTNADGGITEGEYHNVQAGDYIIVRVTPSTRLGERINAYLTELDKAFAKCDEYFMGSVYYGDAKVAYDSAKAAISAADSLQTAIDVLNAAKTAIAKQIADADKVNSQYIETAQNYLNQYLPTIQEIQAGKFTKQYIQVYRGFAAFYASMTDYQKDSLTGAQQLQIEALAQAYGADGSTLPDAILHTIKVNVVGDGAERYLIGCYEFWVTGSEGDIPNDSVGPYFTYACENPYSTRRESIWQYIDKTWQEGGYFETVRPKSAYRIGFFNVSNLGTYLAGDSYTFDRDIYKVEVSGADADDYTLTMYEHEKEREYVWFGPNNSDAKNIYTEANLNFENFPDNDVTVTLYISPTGEAPIEETGETFEEAQTVAKATLSAVYAGYDSGDYTSENWDALEAVKNDGLSAIDAAADVAAVTAVKNAALAAMKAIPKKNTVTVILRNDTYADGDFTGEIVKESIPLETTDTMMTAICKALQNNGFTWNGGTENYNVSYVSSIEKGGKKLAEFSGGTGSGWMGTLNDWFINESLAAFGADDGKLKAGDVICVEYTCELGADIRAGVEGNTDTSLYELALTGGTLSPSFNGATTSYLFTLDEDVYTTELTFSSNNRGFQSRAYLNKYDASAASWYRSGDTIPVKIGDVLYVGVGASSWPSMGSGTPTVYTIAIVDGPGAVASYINDLPEPNKLTLADKDDVAKAKAMFDALSTDDKAQISEALQAKLAACVARMSELEAIGNVISLIDALPEANALVYADKPAVIMAKTLYDALGETLQLNLQVRYINKLNACVAKMEQISSAMEGMAYDAYLETGALVLSSTPNPVVDSIGGEWAIIGLARSGYAVPDGYYDIYLSNLATKLTDNNGNLLGGSGAKYTEYSRAILAVTAVGGDVTDVAGYNLLTYLADFNKVNNQGINGPIWALMALDSYAYEIPTVDGVSKQTTREMLVDYILNAQLSDGGWSLSYTGNSGSPTASADPDMTAMAMQALAPYYDTDSAVKAALDEALNALSDMQAPDGTFGSAFGGGQSSESTVQVIVALTALGINPTADERFIKNGNDPIEALMLFYVNDGGFKHILSGNTDGMATEQSYYALTSYFRLINNQNALYDMRDVTAVGDQQKANRVVSLIDAIKAPVTLGSESEIEAAIIAYNALTSAQKTLVTNIGNLESAIAELSALKIAECERLIDAIGKVTLASEKAIVSARTYYTLLSAGEQAKVSNYDALEAAEKALKELKDKQTPGGSTKTVTVTIDNIEYVISEATKASIDTINGLLNPKDAANALPEDFSQLTEDQVDKIIEIYKQYDALTDDEKLFVTNYGEFEDILKKLGEELHYDSPTGVDVRGNDGLPWNVKINVSPQVAGENELAKIRETLGEDAEFLVMYDISFVNILTGEEYQPPAPIKLKISTDSMDYAAYKTVVIVHVKADGTYEYLEGVIEDGNIVFTASSFSTYGVAGFMGTWDDIVGGDEPASGNLTWLWIALIVIGVTGICGMLIMKKKRGSAQSK